jgi:iron(III) transport system ATP-binding protein
MSEQVSEHVSDRGPGAGTLGLSIRGLRKSYEGHVVLDGVDLDVPAKSLTAVLGPSGSGKTTLLRVIAGFERADRGSVSVAGTVVDGEGRRVPPERRRIGYVPQEGALFPHLTVTANIGFGVPRAGRRERVAELLEMIGLRSFGDRYPHELSGGEQQRVALARALAIRPSLVLLDEPFSSLDAGLRASVRRDVARVLHEAEATAILVTHDQDEALSMASRVAVLRHGRFVQHDSALEVYARPADVDVARFVGDANLLRAVCRGDRAETGLGTHLLAGTFSDGAPLVVLVRPEDIELSPLDAPRGATGGSAEWKAGTVLAVDYHGHDSVVGVELDVPVADAPIQVRLAAAPAVQPGDRVVVRARTDAVTAWPA